MCELYIQPTKDCWGKWHLQSKPSIVHKHLWLCSKDFKAWHSNTSCGVWQTEIWGCRPGLLISIYFPKISFWWCGWSQEWDEIATECIGLSQPADMISSICVNIFPKAVCSYTVCYRFCTNRGASCCRDISRREPPRISALYIKMFLPKLLLTLEIFRFHLQFSAGSPVLHVALKL